MSGGSGNTNSTQTSELPAGARPYAQQNLQRAANMSNEPGQVYSGQRYAGLNSDQNGALDRLTQYGMNGTESGNAGLAGLSDTLSGKYLSADSNPYLGGQIDAAQQDVVRNYNTTTRPAMDAALVRSGSFGNSGVMQMQQEADRNLQGQLGNISTQMRGQNYAQERDRQMQALGLAPQYSQMQYGDANAALQAGNARQQDTQGQYDAAMQIFNEQQNLPLQRLGILQGALGMGSNGQSTTSSGATPQANPGTAALGGAATGATLGSQVSPGWGTLVGGLIGAGAGYYSAR